MAYKQCAISGVYGVDAFIDVLRNASISAESILGKCAERDVNLLLSCGAEVKHDEKEQFTGNVAIEWWNTRQCKASGLSVTNADFWVFVLDRGEENEVWITSVAALKQYVKDVRPLKTVYNAGDNNAALHIYPSEQIRQQIFRRLDGIGPAEIAGSLKGLFNARA